VRSVLVYVLGNGRKHGVWHGASPMTFFIASAMASGVARVGLGATVNNSPAPPARRAALTNTARRFGRGVG
jgi:alkanesulfonate monooxygenase SsuD/methylene tetrahydromethanopterin reductase-like flavin-dependent oxidoreductase (luciferase family)